MKLSKYSLTVVIALGVASPLFAAWFQNSNAQTVKIGSANQSPELILQTGHSMKLNAVALSSDNRVLASASVDNTIKLWDVASGRELRTLTGHGGGVKCVAISMDGKLLASGSNDKTIKLWEVETGRELQTLAGHSASVEAIAFAADGRLLVSGSSDNTAKIWDLANTRDANTLTGHSDWVTSVAFSADGKWIATGSRDKTVRLWEVATGRDPRVLTGHTERIKGLAFSPDAQWLASASFDGTVKLWRTATGKEAKSLKGGAGNLIAVAFTPDGREALAASYNKTIKVWDVRSGREVRAAGDPASLDFVESIAFAADGQTFASSANTAAELYESATGKKLRTFESRAAGFYTVALNGDGHWLASGSKDNMVRLWDTTTGRELPALVGHTGYVTSVAFNRDGGSLASASLDRSIRIWETSTGLETRKLVGHDDTVNAIAFSPDSRWLASGSYDKTVRLWDVADGREVRKLLGHSGEITSVAFSADGRWLASGSVDKTIRVWDTTTWASPRVFDVRAEVNVIAFSPDGKWLASGTSGKTIALWEMASGQQARTLITEAAAVRALAFSFDGQWLASAGSDKAITLWSLSSGSEQRVLRGHSDTVNGVIFTSDGKWLISGSEDGSTLLWETDTGKKVATLMSLRDGNDWLVVTPDGLFDGSPAAWNQILWRFSGDTFNVKPVELFFNEFYYPSLLAEIFAGKKPKAPADISQKDRRQPQVKLGLASQIDERDVTIRAVNIRIALAEGAPDNEHPVGSGVRDVRLFRNGSLVKVWHGDLQLNQGQALLETTIPVVAGTNVLTAYAFNRDNIKSSDALLTLNGDDKLKRAGTAYILVTGVNQYANPEYNLRYAVADAEDFGAELQRTQSRLGHFEHIELIRLLDAEATKANMMLALRRLADSNNQLPAGAPKALERIKTAQPEDAVVVYFAGHGTAPNDGRFYLIPHDLGYRGPRKLRERDRANLETILDHSISDRDLEAALEKIDAAQFLLVIDACNSGQALEAEEKRRGPMNAKGLAQLAYEKGMYILTAAQSYQAALEPRRLGHGYLTYVLVEEGLKTSVADVRPKDGQVELSEWLDYAVGRVPQMQAGTAKDAQGRLLEQEEDPAKKKERDVQRPRVFYRSGLDTTQLIVAKPGAK